MVRIFTAVLTFAALASVQPVAANETALLCFTSHNCPPCRRMQPVIGQLEAAGYPIRRVDLGRADHQHLAIQFRVARVPCFVMVAAGNEVARIEGATSNANLEELFALARVAPRGVSLERNVGQTPDPSPLYEQVGFEQLSTGTHPQPMPVEYSNGSTPPPPLRSAAPPPTAAEGRGANTPDGAILDATVRIKIVDPQGYSTGTGTIIHATGGEAIVVTCGHLFRESQGRGQISVDLFRSTPSGPVESVNCEGTLIARYENPDLGLLTIRVGRDVTAAPLANRGTVVEVDQNVFTAGCNNGDDPTLSSSLVTGVDRFEGPSNIEVAGAPVEGRSGGGLFTQAGELVGVCFAAEPVRDEGLYVALSEIHQMLDRHQLSSVIDTSPSASAAMAAAVPPPAPREIRGQGPDGRHSPAAPLATTDAARASLSELTSSERAALEEIAALSVRAEVVCIIRPKDASGRSEVITLDDVSPAFVRALSAR